MEIEYAGSVYVDAGMVWVGDPCYVIGKDSSHAPEKWDDFVAKMDFVNPHAAQEVLGEGIGLAVPTGMGDGIYPVFVERLSSGRVVALHVDLLMDEYVQYLTPEERAEYVEAYGEPEEIPST